MSIDFDSSLSYPARDRPAHGAVTPAPDGGPASGAASAPGRSGEAGEDAFSFWDLLDVVNPLQHIPVVSTIYREITGDEIGNAAKLAGGTLFGGVMGLAASAVDVLVKESTGRDTGEHVVALFSDETDEAGNAPTDGATTVTGIDTPAERTMAAVHPDATPRPAPSIPGGATATAETAPPDAAAKDPMQPAMRWFPIDRSIHVRQGPPASAPRPAVEVRKPVPADAPAAASPQPSLPLGVVTAPAPAETAQAASSPKAPAPTPEAIRRALAAQGLQPALRHPMLNGADAAGTEAPYKTGTAARTAPVDVPAWFDTAMVKALKIYEKTGQLGDS